MSSRIKKPLLASLLIITVALAFSAWLLQRQMVDAQKQIEEAKNQTECQNIADQITYYQNLTENLQNQLNSSQTQISNLQNLTSSLQNQVASLQTQLDNLQTRTYNVTVTKVDSTSWQPIVGLTIQKEADLTLNNTGNEDVGGITSDIKIVTDGNDTSQYFDINVFEPSPLGILHVGESVVIRVAITTGLGVPVDLSKTSLEATIMLDTIILDQATIPLGEFF
jgi:TolA-binding protein